MSLENTREKIDAIDSEIVRLLDLRAKAGREAAALKKALGLPLRNPGREREVLAGLAARSNGSMPGRGLETIYRAIIAETLAIEGSDAPCPGPAGKRDIRAEVRENFPVASGFYRMRLHVPELAGAFLPGQFFQLRLDVAGGGPPFLRRPFAPSEYTDDGFAFVYAVVGGGTGRLSRLSPGGEVGILAPLGNPFVLLPSGRSALLIGGGYGAPSLAPLARALRGAGAAVTVVLGARTGAGLLERGGFEEAADRLILATDDGSCGIRGTSIDAFRLEAEKDLPRPDRIYACGPMPMLRGTAALAEELGVDCEVSLEERMACGFGACVGCVVPVRDIRMADGYAFRRVCHEGPVFNSRNLAWDRIG